MSLSTLVVVMAEWRQRAERFFLPLPLRYRTSGASNWLTGQTHNISGSGILFGADHELPVGTEIEMHLAMEAFGKSYPSQIAAQARIVRIVAPQRVSKIRLAQSSGVALAARFETHQILPRQLGQV